MFDMNHHRTPEEMAMLAKLFATSLSVQKTYGKTADQIVEMAEAFAFFTRGLPFDKLCVAFVAHVELKQELPTPADINMAVNPPKPEISLGEYLQACDYQKRNNFPLYSDAYEIKKAYEAQQLEKREGWDKWHAEQTRLVQEKAPSLLIQDEGGDHE